MPNWTKQPPEDPRGHGLPIVRTPAARHLQAIVTSTDLIGCDTHFWGGHTVPCERPECDACHDGIKYDWHGYLSAFNPLDQLHFIFEMTNQAAKAFTAYRTAHDTLRCCEFKAWRWGQRKNGRVMIKTQHSAVADHVLPQPPDITRVMAIIWRLNPKEVFLAGKHLEQPRVHASSRGNGQSSDPRIYDAPNP